MPCSPLSPMIRRSGGSDTGIGGLSQGEADQAQSRAGGQSEAEAGDPSG
jgi:hypothetical protein